MVISEETDTGRLRDSEHLSVDPYAFSGGRIAALNYIAVIMQFLRGRKHVLDLGCGEGSLLSELDTAGVRATGVDKNFDGLRELSLEGFDVLNWDVFDFLEQYTSIGQREYDAIVISHLIEHFTADDQLELLRLSERCLASNGRLVIVTPNFENPVINRKVFWLDPTHVRPMPIDLLRRSVQDLGLTVIGEGATWPWDRRRLLREMRQAGHEIPVRTMDEWRRITLRYAKLFALYGPQLNLLRGDTWLVAEKRG